MIGPRMVVISVATALAVLGGGTPAVASAGTEAIVESYFNAINDHDYRTAWDLGGKNFSSSYRSFVDGFDTTFYDVVTIAGSHGDVVDVFLDAEHYNGSDQQYSGTYTVHGGEITAAHLVRR